MVDFCGLLLALSVTVNDPVRVPTAVGVKVTLMVQLVPAARVVPQVVAEIAKSPVVELAMFLSATFCLLVSVNSLAGLVVPTARAG